MAKALCVLRSPPGLKVNRALSILLLLVIEFNPYNIYATLLGAPMYGNSSIFHTLVIG